MKLPDTVVELATALVTQSSEGGLTIATAESCTGGLLAGALTAIPGSSAVFDRGWVTYSNQAKTELLGVSADLITQHGAVSLEVAEAMALGVVERSNASLAISISGIAGPGGGTPDKPVGTVCFGQTMAKRSLPPVQMQWAGLDRDGVRYESVVFALRLLITAASTIRTAD